MTSSATNSRSGNLVGQAGNWVKEKGWRIATVMAAGSLALAGCAPQGEATPIETEKPKTIEQYLEEFTEYKDPSELQLAAGADADTFGRWVLDVQKKWRFAGCDDPGAIVDATIALRMMSDADGFYQQIAEANAKAPTVAMFGTDWASKPSAVSWSDSMTNVNAVGIDFCVQGAEDETTVEEFVSASQVGTDAEGYPVFEVVTNIIPGPHSSELARQSVGVYDTSVEDGNLVIDSMILDGTEIK